MDNDLVEKLEEIVRNTDLIKYLEAIRKVNIPGAWLVGGALRNTLWKQMFPESTLQVNDIDVPYFSKLLPREMNQKFVDDLEKVYPTGKWECDNQAWVHTYEPRTDYWMPHAPYNSMEESMVDFWFSVNTIGVRLNNNDEIEILHPEALDDLFAGILRVLPFQKDNPYPWFEKKIEKITSKCFDIKVIR